MSSPAKLNGETNGGASHRLTTMQQVKARLILGLIYALNVFFAYMLMLAIMTYNGGIFIAVVVGLAVGHAIFLRPSTGSVLNDVCCAN